MITKNSLVLARSEELHCCAQGFADIVDKPSELKMAAAQLGLTVRKFASVVDANNPEFEYLVCVLDFLGSQIQFETNRAIKNHPDLREHYLESHGEAAENKTSFISQSVAGAGMEADGG